MDTSEYHTTSSNPNTLPIKPGTVVTCDLCGKELYPTDDYSVIVRPNMTYNAEHLECRELADRTASIVTAEWYARRIREGIPAAPGTHIRYLDEIYPKSKDETGNDTD